MTTELLENPKDLKTIKTNSPKEDYYLYFKNPKGVYLYGDLLESGISREDFIYDGSGWLFDKSCEEKLSKTLKPYGYEFKKMPLTEGKTFEYIKQSSTCANLLKEKIDKENALNSLLRPYLNVPIEDVTEKIIEDSPLDSNKKKEAKKLLDDYEKTKNRYHYQSAKETLHTNPMPTNQKNGFSIKFLNEMDKNYLLEDAEEMPKLINFTDEYNKQKPFIRKGVVGWVVGAGGVGKTHFLTQLGLSIASGEHFLENYPIEKPGSVFIALGENSDEDIHRLIRKISKNLFKIDDQMKIEEIETIKKICRRVSVKSFSGAEASFIKQGNPTDVYNMLKNALIAQEPEEGWSCIIFDPISRFLGAEAETDNASATQFIALLENLILVLKGRPTIILGHHMNKSGVSGTNTDQAAARGSSALTDAVRFQINLEKKLASVSGNKSTEKTYEKDKIWMRYVKTNFTAPIPDQTLKKDPYGVLTIDRDQ